MECAVYNCYNNQSNNIKKLSFFRFPKDEKVSNQWKEFCRCEKVVRTSVVCQEHFLRDDVLGSMQFEMGLCSRKILRRGAIPCIYGNQSAKLNETLLSPENICRVCKSTETNKLHKLTTRMPEHPEKMLLDVLLEITNIKPPLSHEASLPQTLCDKCRVDLENAYKFIVQARQTHEELLSKPNLSSKSSFVIYLNEAPLYSDSQSASEIDSDVDMVEEKIPVRQKVEISLSDRQDKIETAVEMKSQMKEDVVMLDEDSDDVLDSIDDKCREKMPQEEASLERKSDCEEQRAGSVKMRSDIAKPRVTLCKASNTTKPNSWQCDICENVFKTLGAFKKHTLKHASLNEWFSCYHCDRKFYLKNSLKRHIETVNQQEVRIYKKHEYNGQKATEVDINWCHPHGCKVIQCKLCIKKFTKISDLRKHLAEHINNVSFDKHGKSVQTFKEYLYPRSKLNTENQLLEQINMDLSNGKYENFYSITNEAGSELSIDSSETESDSEIKIDDDARREYECELCGQKFLRKYKVFEHQRNSHSWMEAQHICTRCNARFVSKDLLQIHSDSLCMNFNKEYMCKKCPIKFRWKENFDAHMRTHIKQQTPQICEECGRTYANEKALTYHMRREHCDKSKLLRCKWCDRIFFRRDYLVIHLKRHNIVEKDIPLAESLLAATSKPNGTKIISCKLCDLHFASIAELRAHIHTESESALSMHCGQNAMLNYTIVNEAGYELDIDDSETDDEVHLLGRNCKKQNFYTCNICLLKCKRKFELMKHQLNVHRYDKMPHKCNFCVFSSVSKEVVEHHERTLCTNDEKKHVCPRCNYKFMWPENLEMHMSKQHATQSVFKEEAESSTNSNKNTLTCPHCERPYKKEYHLKKHIEDVHINGDGGIAKHRNVKKRYLCSQCGSGWESIFKLNEHIRVHTGEKPFNCDICDRSFTRRTGLKFHRRRHTGDRPYVCSVCDKGFVLHGKLKEHMLIHSGLRPYKCTYCDKAYRHSHDVKVHMQQHISKGTLQNEELICKTCGGVFTDSEDLVQHRAECTESVI